jgi:hypothetical protein
LLLLQVVGALKGALSITFEPVPQLDSHQLVSAV